MQRKIEECIKERDAHTEAEYKEGKTAKKEEVGTQVNGPEKK